MDAQVDPFKLIEEIPITEPCPYAAAQIAECGSARGFSLSRIQGRMGKCVWCEKSLRGRQQRWCSSKCAQSAQLRCWPAQPYARMHRLIHIQNCACAGCGESYEEEIKDLILDLFQNENRYRRLGDEPKLVKLITLNWRFGHRVHLDHIVPLFKGGHGIDPGNLQILCVPCHKLKTIEERR